MQCLKDGTNAIKTGYEKGYDQSVNLPAMLMKMIRTQKLLIVLLVTLRSIYRKQAMVVTHKQSLKRSERTRKTIRKTSKPSN